MNTVVNESVSPLHVSFTNNDSTSLLLLVRYLLSISDTRSIFRVPVEHSPI